MTALIFVATVAQLVLATLAPDLPQFRGKAFGARLVAYPLLLLLVPVLWAALRRRGASGRDAARRDAARRDAAPPWTGFALIMSPFLVDVTGNAFDLYDSVGWWDDANYLVNWFLLCMGVGVLLLRSRAGPPWALGVAVAGIGALLAIGWELAEWFFFIRHGTEINTAYEDTLGDEGLGVVGGAIAALAVAGMRRRVRGP